MSSPRGLQLGNRESSMCVLGCGVLFQIAGQQQWVATGQSSQLWWSSKLGDHRVFSTGYGCLRMQVNPFLPLRQWYRKIRKLSPLSESELLSEVEKESANKEAFSTAHQRMLKNGEVQDVLQQSREVADIGGLRHPTVAKCTWCSSGQEMLKTGEVQTAHSPDAEKRGSP